MAIGWNGARGVARAIALLGLMCGGPALGQVFKSVNFDEHPQPATFSAEGAEVTLQPVKDEDGLIEVAAAIRIPGFQTVIVTEEGGSSAGYDRWVGIGKLSVSDVAPSVLLQGFTGGAHCCATLKVVTPYAGKLKVLSFDSIDGGGSESFPRDIDKDGVIDFQRQDDRFRYQFASGAGSYSPPLIYNVYKGQIIDVTGEPAFRPLWETFAREARALCAERDNDDRNGACAAYVAAGARLGRFESAMRDASALANRGPDAELPEGCQTERVNYECPKGKEIKFHTFDTALRWFLKDAGYID